MKKVNPDLIEIDSGLVDLDLGNYLFREI